MNSTRITRIVAIVAIVAGCSSTGTTAAPASGATQPTAATSAAPASIVVTSGIPQMTVRFAVEPYADHTDASIALAKGWFNDVGIDLHWQNIDADKISSVLVAGTVDVASAAPALLIPSMKQAQFQNFVFGDLFQGYAIMAQAGAKRYSDFVSAGQSPADAIRSTMAQLKGKTFTYPAEAAIKPFIDLAFQKGGLTLQDVQSQVQPDANGVALMLAKKADFEVGGVPSHVTLQSQGFVPILSSIDLVKAAVASPDSVELRAIAHNGWTTTKAYADANHDTLLRLASVKFRIMQFINDHPDEACSIQMPFLNQQAGSGFASAECKVIYNSLDPFYTFKAQSSWFNNKSDPLYWSYELDSVINLYVQQGLFTAGEFKAADISQADQIYQQLDQMRQQTEKNLPQLVNATGAAAQLRDMAKTYYDDFDYLDSSRLSQQALTASGA